MFSTVLVPLQALPVRELRGQCFGVLEPWGTQQRWVKGYRLPALGALTTFLPCAAPPQSSWLALTDISIIVWFYLRS